MTIGELKKWLAETPLDDDLEIMVPCDYGDEYSRVVGFRKATAYLIEGFDSLYVEQDDPNDTTRQIVRVCK